MRLYQMQDSGNCYKLRLLANLLGQPLDLIDIDILKGESRTSDFLTKNPNGRVPLLELDDGRLLAESNAILFWLAQDTAFWPEDTFQQARVLQWMFFEQYSHEPYIAVARFWQSISPTCPEDMKNRFPEWHQKGYAALDVMETHLSAQPFFVGNRCTIADIALFAYSHLAHEGGFDLTEYSSINAWVSRITNMTRYIPIDWRS
tara:strand:- start:78119 stop:78727 length:609 start_codon:yes stop_codon:yes gene_type:complete